MGQFLNSVREVKRNYNIYDNWEQQQADEKAQKQYLAKNLQIPKDKVELTEARAKTVIRAAEMLDNRSENNAEDMEMCTSALSMLAVLPMSFLPLLGMRMKSLKAANMLSFGSLAATFLATSGLILWGTAKQKEASRIGRFQAKQNELKDVKNFVIYTPEQIEAAVKKAEEIPDEKEKKSFLKSYSNIKQVFKDKKAYLEDKNKQDDSKIENLKSKTYTPEQLAKADNDRELIVDAVKDINVKAEEYSENVENAFDTLGVFSAIFALPVAAVLNKTLKLFGGNVAKHSKIISGIATGITTLTLLTAGTSVQKEAARIGRYKARQDLMKDPAALLAFTDEQKAQAKDIKAEEQKKTFFKKIASNFEFLGKYFDDRKEYKNYKESELKKNEKIIKILREETEITDKQLQDAKHLQEKVFMTFDELDEMSQRYSEDIEAGTEIAKEGFGLFWGLASAFATAGLSIAFMKGKVPIDKIIKTFSNFTFDKESSFRKIVDKGYAMLKEDKDLRKDFNNIFIKGTGNLKKNPEFNKIMDEFKAECLKLSMAGGDQKNNLMENHFKKGPVAKWGRNLTFDIFKIKARNTLKKAGIEIPEELKFNYSNYKTFWHTAAAAFVPFLGIMVSVPYAFNAWLTNIQKKAGKIGIMKAMEKIDDPKLFVNENDTSATSVTPGISQQSAQSANLLNKFKTI